MSKKLLSITLTLILLISLMPDFSFAVSPSRVLDESGYMSPDEKAALEAQIARIQSETGLDVVIGVVDTTGGKSSMAYADDIYDYGGYGLDSQYSGLMLLINMDIREVWISTTGRAINIYTDSRITSMVQNVTPYLADADYFKASSRFLEDVARYAEQGVPIGQTQVEGSAPYVKQPQASYLTRLGRMALNPIVYLIAFVLSIGITFAITLLNRGRVTTTHQTYELPGSFNLTENSDTYLREFLTKTKVVKNDNKSSTHIGSSGRSHGGGGGRF